MLLTYRTDTRSLTLTPASASVPRSIASCDLGVRLAVPADTIAILELIASSYGRDDDEARRAYWQWKHEANPFGPSPCLVAEADGRLVGVRIFLRWNWRAGASTVRAVRAVDTATHPDWRGRGIFSRLTLQLVEEVRRDGVSFIYNTPNHKSMPGYVKMGWTPVARIPLWVRPLRISGLVRRALTSGAAAPLAPADWEAVSSVLGDPRLPAFLSDVALGDERYHTARTLSYLRWRYSDIPGLKYYARFETTGSEGALIIARARLRGRLRELTISELMVTPSARGVRLGRAALSGLARSADADYVAACAAAGTAERDTLIRAGFLPVPHIGPHFTARPLDPAALNPARWANWRCSIGDLEVF